MPKFSRSKIGSHPLAEFTRIAMVHRRLSFGESNHDLGSTETFLPGFSRSRGQGDAMQAMWNLLRDDDGTTAVEYAVMLSLIIVVAMGSIALVGTEAQSMWNGNNSELQRALGN
jgi:pilus assembly protein Flp/PilA